MIDMPVVDVNQISKSSGKKRKKGKKKKKKGKGKKSNVPINEE